ncbi:MAG TPA: hypothetical protein VE086_10385, partial [Chthoniobacterales bacterium]|nr:hypothetical protein [Chthoniobacterales bacterium]
MKKLITILFVSTFAIATVANAAPEDPKAKKSAKPGPVQRQSMAPKQHVVSPKQNFTSKSSHVQAIHPQHTVNLNSTKIHQNNVSKQQVHTYKNVGPKKIIAPPSQNLSRNQNLKAVEQSNQLPAVQKNQKNFVAPNTKPIPNVQNIQAKYKNFKAQPRPAVVPSAQFNQNYRIAGAQNWSGSQYHAFSSYQPQWHDHGWWQANYAANLLLIGGGWYYWNSGYWYPAWGYDSAYSYYPYDGPIYTGEQRRPFDEVVADVQASLQEQGYYQGE